MIRIRTILHATDLTDYSRPALKHAVHLARQHIGTQELLSVCFETWKAQASLHVPPSLMTEIKNLVQQSTADSRKAVQVQTYKQICQLLKQGKHL